MTRADRWEAALALAMLPVGVTLGLLSALASVGLLFLSVLALIWGVGEPRLLLLAAWCFVGGAVLAWAAVAAIEVVSAFDWRPLPRILVGIAIVAAACPLWWGPALP